MGENTDSPILALVNWNLYVQALQMHPGNTLVIYIVMFFVFSLLELKREREGILVTPSQLQQR